MQIDLLKEIASIIAGNEAAKVVVLLYDKKNVNEFLIAKKLSLTVNQARNVLYKLADEGLVSFTRKKDARKGGWYTYFWTLNKGRGLLKFRDRLGKEIENLEGLLESRRIGRFYICQSCGMEYNEESALTGNYTCPECGETLALKETQKDIDALEGKIRKLKMVVEEISKELGGVMKKEEKLKARRMKVEKAKKDRERHKKKKARERELKKLARAKAKARKKRKLKKARKARKSSRKKKIKKRRR
jgi:transcription initiation factor TFIIE subunit alpha